MPFDQTDHEPVEKITRRRTTRQTPANAIHLMIGILAECKQSVRALRHEITEAWGDLEEVRKQVDNAFFELAELRQTKAKYPMENIHDH